MEVKILGKKIKILLIDKKNLQGLCDSTKNEISINKNLPTENKEETLLHEIIHNISDNVAIGLTEEQTQALGSCLYSVLKDNDIFSIFKTKKP
jgi:Zn-dependent peptidase ImmA (M78 family)